MEARDCPIFNPFHYYVDKYNIKVYYISSVPQQFKYYFFNNILDTSLLFQISRVTLGGIVGVPLASLTTTCL